MSSSEERGSVPEAEEDDELCRFGLKMRMIMAATMRTRSKQMHCLRPALRWYLRVQTRIRVITFRETKDIGGKPRRTLWRHLIRVRLLPLLRQSVRYYILCYQE